MGECSSGGCVGRDEGNEAGKWTCAMTSKGVGRRFHVGARRGDATVSECVRACGSHGWAVGGRGVDCHVG